MKRIVILLSIIMLTKIICFSQDILRETNQDSIVSITSKQLKYANLIFVEHEKLINENSLLNSTISNLEGKIKTSEKLDSIRIKQNEELEKSYSLQIKDLNNNISKKNRYITGLKIGCITLSVSTLLLILFK